MVISVLEIMKNISVVVCTYDEPVEMFEQCLCSLLQNDMFSEIIVVDSSTNDIIKNLCERFGYRNVCYHYMSPRGLSEARNEGIKYAQNEHIAFTDPDCIVDNKWLENLYSISQEYDAVIVGGKVLPKWLANPPYIFKKSRLAWNLYSLVDQGDSVQEVKKIVGANFMINISKFSDVEYFCADIGRIKGTLLGGEETDLCERVANKGLKVFYTPFALVWHQVPKERLTYRWMIRRTIDGAISRSTRGGVPKPYKTKYSVYDLIFLLFTSIPYVFGFIAGKRNKRYIIKRI